MVYKKYFTKSSKKKKELEEITPSKCYEDWSLWWLWTLSIFSYTCLWLLSLSSLKECLLRLHANSYLGHLHMHSYTQYISLSICILSAKFILYIIVCLLTLPLEFFAMWNLSMWCSLLCFPCLWISIDLQNHYMSQWVKAYSYVVLRSFLLFAHTQYILSWVLCVAIYKYGAACMLNFLYCSLKMVIYFLFEFLTIYGYFYFGVFNSIDLYGFFVQFWTAFKFVLR